MYTCACNEVETTKHSVAAAMPVEIREHAVEVIFASWPRRATFLILRVLEMLSNGLASSHTITMQMLHFLARVNRGESAARRLDSSSRPQDSVDGAITPRAHDTA